MKLISKQKQKMEQKSEESENQQENEESNTNNNNTTITTTPHVRPTESAGIFSPTNASFLTDTTSPVNAFDIQKYFLDNSDFTLIPFTDSDSIETSPIYLFPFYKRLIKILMKKKEYDKFVSFFFFCFYII